MPVSRREFLTRVGHAGGYSAAVLAMRGLGLFPMSSAAAQTVINAAPGSGKGSTVAILGGGIAGLVAAYELRALGYHCTVLEARSRPGGRNWTVRPGDKIEFLDGTVQHCSWDPGHYQNFGPARLPSTHKAMLGYCKTFGIALEVEVNTSRSSLLQNDRANGGKPVVQRQAINDTRGHVAELLTKCMATGSLDSDFTPADRARMLDFLRLYGPLDSAGQYKGSDRAGYAIPPGAGTQEGTLSTPLDMHTLLDANFWDGLLFEETFDWQATMFQPVGGMDRIPYAFAKSVGSLVRYNAPISEIRKTSSGVRVQYQQHGQAHSLEAAFCICALPLTQLRKIPNDFSAPVQKVIAECTYSDAYKIAWESRRFWEQDYNIYGGLEFVNIGCSPVWFPSSGFMSKRGILVSGYTEERGSLFSTLNMAHKLDESRKSIERLHPGHGVELEKPLYVNWGKIPYNEGSWINTYGKSQPRNVSAVNAGAAHAAARVQTTTNIGYESLLAPDGPIFFAGDHLSHLTGWQEGAAESSIRAINLLNDHVKQSRLASSSS